MKNLKILFFSAFFLSTSCAYKEKVNYPQALELNEYKLYNFNKTKEAEAKPSDLINVSYQLSEEEKIVLMADEYIYQEKWKNAFDILSQYKPGLRNNQDIEDRMIYTAIQLKYYHSAATLLRQKLNLDGDQDKNLKTRELLNKILQVKSEQDAIALQEQVGQYFYQHNFKAKTEQSDKEKTQKESIRMPAQWINKEN